MPDPLANQIVPMTEAAGIVAAVGAVPLIAIGALGSRMTDRPFWPRWKPYHVGSTALDWAMLYFLYFLFNVLILLVLYTSGLFQVLYGADFPTRPSPTDKASSQLAGMWAQLIAAPLIIGIGLMLRVTVHQVPLKFDIRDAIAHSGFGAWVALLVTPLVYVVFMVTLALTKSAENHPLAQLGAGKTVPEQLFFMLVVCGIVPLVEEFLFRGVVLRWASATAFNGAILMVISGCFAVTPSVGSDFKPGPIVLFIVLAGLYAAVTTWGYKLRARFPMHTVSGIIATSTLFAIVHSSVWPSPVPLFVLACALGYVTARTGGITAAVVLHGLFNAVSTVFLIRGGSGL